MPSKTREKLIDVARQLFVHQGVERTTMNDIAEASSKGRRTIYTYFKNKKEIYNAVLEKESDRMMEELREIATDGSPVDERLRRVLLKRLAQGSEQPGSNNSFRSIFRFDMRRNEKIRRMVRDKEKALISELLEEGVSAGRFHRERAELLNVFLVRCLQSAEMADMSAEEMQRTPAAHEALVEFIISDITIAHNE